MLDALAADMLRLILGYMQSYQDQLSLLLTCRSLFNKLNVDATWKTMLAGVRAPGVPLRAADGQWRQEFNLMMRWSRFSRVVPWTLRTRADMIAAMTIHQGHLWVVCQAGLTSVYRLNGANPPSLIRTFQSQAITLKVLAEAVRGVGRLFKANFGNAMWDICSWGNFICTWTHGRIAVYDCRNYEHGKGPRKLGLISLSGWIRSVCVSPCGRWLAAAGYHAQCVVVYSISSSTTRMMRLVSKISFARSVRCAVIDNGHLLVQDSQPYNSNEPHGLFLFPLAELSFRMEADQVAQYRCFSGSYFRRMWFYKDMVVGAPDYDCKAGGLAIAFQWPSMEEVWRCTPGSGYDSHLNVDHGILAINGPGLAIVDADDGRVLKELPGPRGSNTEGCYADLNVAMMGVASFDCYKKWVCPWSLAQAVSSPAPTIQHDYYSVGVREGTEDGDVAMSMACGRGAIALGSRNLLRVFDVASGPLGSPDSIPYELMLEVKQEETARGAYDFDSNVDECVLHQSPSGVETRVIRALASPRSGPI